MNFTPEQLAAQAKAKARAEVVETKYEKYSDEWFVEYNLLHLQEVAAEGLSACYKGSVDSFMCDLFPDFSWEADRSQSQMRAVLDDERLVAIAAWFREQHGHDIIAAFELSLQP